MRAEHPSAPGPQKLRSRLHDGNGAGAEPGRGQVDQPDAQATIAALLRKIFRFIDGGFESQRVEFRPLGEARLKVATLPSLWNSQVPRHQVFVRDLGQYIATQLLRSSRPAFVFFHFDGDAKWSERSSGINEGRFETRVRSKIRNCVRGFLAKRGE